MSTLRDRLTRLTELVHRLLLTDQRTPCRLVRAPGEPQSSNIPADATPMQLRVLEQVGAMDGMIGGARPTLTPSDN